MLKSLEKQIIDEMRGVEEILRIIQEHLEYKLYNKNLERIQKDFEQCHRIDNNRGAFN